MRYFILVFPIHFLCLLQTSPKNLVSKIFSDQLSISQTLQCSPCLTLKSKCCAYFTFSCLNKKNVSIKVTNFLMLKDNESNPFNISTRRYHFNSPLLELPISYVKHCFQFFSLVFNHFSLKAHLSMQMNNSFIKKMFKFNENVQALMRYFLILGFSLCYEIKLLLIKLKTNEKKKHKNVIIFFIFFINSYQLFYDNTSTLTITNSNDFSEIERYKDNTKFINIGEGIYFIPNNAFSGWPSVNSVNFGNSTTDIGNYVFSSCLSLERIIFGENVTSIGSGAFSSCSSIKDITIPNSVTTIGSSAFSLCSSIKDIIIPNSVTTIGSSAFSSCSDLMILTLGYRITEIGESAFSNCNALECIYYYGETEPAIGEYAFYNVSTNVITYSTYIGSNFGGLSVDKENAGESCKAIATHSFSSSHTFSRSNTYSQSNPFSSSHTFSRSNTFSSSHIFSRSNTFSSSHTFSRSNTFSSSHIFSCIRTYSQSNTFTESFQNDFTFSFSYTLAYTLTIAYSFTYYETQTRSLSLSIFNSTFSYIETEFLYYDYTVIMYSTHFNYYSNFITMFHTNILPSNGLTTNALIGIICGSIALVLIIVGIVIFLIKSNIKKRKSTSTLQFKDSTTSSLNQKEDVNTLVEDIVKEDEDNWL